MSKRSTLDCIVARARNTWRQRTCWTRAAATVLAALAVSSAQAQTALADAPLFSTTSVPGNLVLALSVEFPTAVSAAYKDNNYTPATTYLGYFDPYKCYGYVQLAAPAGHYFDPIGSTNATHDCTNSSAGQWSGNFLNWATMQAVDPFRWALTGGDRSVDSATQTILEKAWAPSNQGNVSNFPNKTLLAANAGGTTPFGGNSDLAMHVVRCGNLMVFGTSLSGGDNCPSSPTEYSGGSLTANVAYSVQVRVAVCVPPTNRIALESNCHQYGSNYKPEGLIQQYAQKIRYSAFGYLNDPTPTGGAQFRDGGVLRARMKFVGPTQPVPGSSAIANVVGASAGQVTSAEWSSTDGVFSQNPDTADASASSEAGSTTVSNGLINSSGVINYLNNFGQASKAYKYYDPVSELYYAATRYLRNLSNVPEYSDLTRFNNGASSLANRIAMKDGFPVITNWSDPILYSCQNNFVLGIGDTNTNQDKDLPGNASYRNNEPSMPSSVSADAIDVIAATNKVGVLDGMGTSIGATNQYNASSNSAYIAGLAYLFHTTDIRSDLPGIQTVSTYWLDVLEGSSNVYKPGPGGRNQFYLATKYGGFTVPTNYSYANNVTPLPQSQWSTTGDTLPIPSAGSPRPDNYFEADQADKMVSGLSAAFANIAANGGAFGSSFSNALPQVAASATASYSTQYDPATWTGEVSGSALTFDANGVPIPATTPNWNFSTRLLAQISGTGWDTGRRVVTWDGSTYGGGGVAFRWNGPSRVSGADRTTLNTNYTAGSDGSAYLDYLRGDASNEAGCTVSCGSNNYRTRTKPLGDISGSKANPVGPPSYPFSDATNPGYSAFKTTWGSRRTVVYVGSNDGMMHAINGALVAPPSSATPPLEADVNFGKEMFAYIPEALFHGTTSPSSSASWNANGLASLGNPAFSHHYMVNATPTVADIDFARTPNSSGVAPTNNPTPDWRSMLIGGLGKGGRAYYALDVTDPVTMSGSESAAASRVLWEFNNSTPNVAGTLGYTYGEPIVVKTRKYGWVVVFTSGYNNSDGKGYFFFVHPKTGLLLEKVSTGVGSPTADAGLAHANAFVVDATDGTADSLYAGDLLGNLWRVDLTTTSGNYAAATKMATLTAAGSPGAAQPVTSRPVIEVHPVTKVRFVMVGTGRLLDDSDIATTQGQTFYAIADGTNASFNATGAPVGFPYSRSVLANDANALVGVLFNSATQAGWYEDLGNDSSTGIAYRVTSDSTTLAGFVAYTATVPNGQACNPSGSSRVLGRDFASAATIVQTLNSSAVLAPALWVASTGTVTDLRFLSVNGKAVLAAGTDTGGVNKIEINPPGNLLLRRLNWRELRVVD